MKTEEEIRDKLDILSFEGDYLYIGDFIKIITPNKAWKEALKWVLEDSEEKKDEN
ncbi:MAG: hypothetical protein ACTSXD_11600 [Candidatus Heimdallarchaeaceae archaeon]